MLHSECAAWLPSAAVWELCIKTAKRRLSLSVPLRNLGRRATVEGGVRVLGVTPEHALRASELPVVYEDPFDRMLAGQAVAERMTLATRDERIGRYHGTTS